MDDPSAHDGRVWEDEPARATTSMTKILIIEDDRSLSEALSYNLRRDGYTPLVARDAASAVRMAHQEKPDLILLDLMLPGGSGFDICRTVRSSSSVPVIILTAKGEEADRVLGLELGADDYVTKPFSLRELLARIKANLRRVELDQRADQSGILRHGVLMVDVEQRSAEAGGTPIPLQPTEFDLLVYFMRHPGIVLTRAQLLTAVWKDEFVGERTVDVHVRRVRAKLEGVGAPNPIRTFHGVGYAFERARSGHAPGEISPEGTRAALNANVSRTDETP